jgi:hypothetical protein
MTRRWEAPDQELLRRILANPPGAAGPERSLFFRDVYFDTTSGDLRQRGVRCRLRFGAGGKRDLSVWMPDGSRTDAAIRELDVARALAGASPPALGLRAIIDPERLVPWVEREVERTWRTFHYLGVPLGDLVADVVTARRADQTAKLHELALEPRPWSRGAAGRSIAHRLGCLVGAMLRFRR